MYGAILGDIIGSPFEFDRGDKTKYFKLFSRRSHFTDDSVMTLAVCEALLKVGQDATVKEIEDAVYDLKAVNPNRKANVDDRTPEMLMDIIEAKGREVAEALAVLRGSR